MRLKIYPINETISNGAASNALLNSIYRTCITYTEGEISGIM